MNKQSDSCESLVGKTFWTTQVSIPKVILLQRNINFSPTFRKRAWYRRSSRKLTRLSVEKLAESLSVGEETLADILAGLTQPGRDMRDEMPAPLLRTDVLSMEDLKPGMELTGTVRNVIDFGAFVDIGVKQDGLVHISKLSKNSSSILQMSCQ